MSAAVLEQSWCPTCREWTVIDVGRPCAWCDTPTVVKRGGWKRPDLQGRISPAAARAIHAKYLSGVSARTLGRELHVVLSYKSAASCADAICTAFRREGLPVRGRIEATVLASTTNGLSPRNDVERRRRRRAAGFTIHLQPLQPTCVAVRTQAPRKGQPCVRPAMFGSDFCFNHDPVNKQRLDEHLAAMRALVSPASPEGQE